MALGGPQINQSNCAIVSGYTISEHTALTDSDLGHNQINWNC